MKKTQLQENLSFFLNKFKTLKDFFIVTQIDSGILQDSISSIKENQIWEFFGNAQYLQCEHG